MAIKNIADNKKAFFEYHILDKLEAGIALVGSEVKSAANGLLNLSDGFCSIEKGELWLKNVYIKSYDKGSYFNTEPRRDRKLLLKRSEINRLQVWIRDSGITIVPLKAYFKNGKIKIEIAVAKGKKLHDKRASIKEKDIIRSEMRALK